MRLTYSHFHHPKNYPYIKPIKGLQGFGISCRFSFNGKEKDDEVSGNGNSSDYGERMNDTRLGIWKSVDKLFSKYPFTSPYAFANNNPIIYVDPNGEDWFYYQAEGSGAADWHWHDGTTLQLRTSSDAQGAAVYTAVQGHAAVVVFNGSRNEQLGAGNNINGTGAVTATVTVYGPGGAEDISTYKGYSMTSDAPSRTPVDEGVYRVRRRASAGSGALPKYYQVFKGTSDQLRTMDGGVNNNAPGQVSANGEGFKDGIFIHRTNNTGTAGGTVSTGCLLIAPGANQWDAFNNQLSPLGNNLDNTSGSRAFTLILSRAGSDHNPTIEAPQENNCGTQTPSLSGQQNLTGNSELTLTR